MHTEIFTLCGSATNDRGKLNILGSFDTIYARQFPCDHHMCEITFSDPDMRPVLDPIQSEFTIQMGKNLSHTHIHTHHYVGFHLERPGEYYFELRVDGETRSRIPLYLVHVQPPKV